MPCGRQYGQGRRLGARYELEEGIKTRSGLVSVCKRWDSPNVCVRPLRMSLGEGGQMWTNIMTGGLVGSIFAREQSLRVSG